MRIFIHNLSLYEPLTVLKKVNAQYPLDPNRPAPYTLRLDREKVEGVFKLRDVELWAVSPTLKNLL